MPRAGGESDKLGNRYEALWTVSTLLDLADGRHESILVEPHGAKSIGIEFIVRSLDGTRNFHSSKRQNAKGEWSLEKLTKSLGQSGRSILGDLFDKLKQDCQALCTFVSSTGANDLREIVERANRRSTVSRFETDLLSSSRLDGQFRKYILKQVAYDKDLAFAFLRRLKVVLIDEGTLRIQVNQKIAHTVYRPDQRPYEDSEVVSLLTSFIIDNIGNDIRKKTIWTFLKSHGFERRDWVCDPSIRGTINAQNRIFISAIHSDLINSGLLSRHETAKILDAINTSKDITTILVTANAGMGKSCVMVELINSLAEAGTPVLVVRIDRHGDAHNTREIGRQMCLPESPTVVLAGVADGRPCVLVIDQLDAVSRVSGRYPHLWEVFDSLYHEAERYPNMKLVLCCRSFDLQHDQRLRSLRNPTTTRVIPISELPMTDVDAAIESAGASSSGLSLKQKLILQTPLHLYLFLESLDQECASTDFRVIGDLFDRYWEYKRSKVQSRLELASQWGPVIEWLCKVMSDKMTVWAYTILLEDQWQPTVDAMLTEHVVIKEVNRIRFFHESFFDYAYARYFVRSEQQLVEFLTHSEQHLFRRAQVRQILVFLRDHNRANYLHQLNDILQSPAIRFHLKRLVLAWLGSLADPTLEEWKIVHTVMQCPSLHRHCLPILRNSLPWFDLLDTQDVVADWLESSDSRLSDRGLWFLTCDAVQKSRSARAAALLTHHYERGGDRANRVAEYFSWGNAHHSRETQELFLRLLEDGVFASGRSDDQSGWSGSWWDSLRDAANHQPLFVLEAIICWLNGRIDSILTTGIDPARQSNHDGDSAIPLIIRIAESNSLDYVDAILPRMLKLIQCSLRESTVALPRDRVWRTFDNSEPVRPDDALLEQMIQALVNLAKRVPLDFEQRLQQVFAFESYTLAFVLLRVWTADPKRFANMCFKFLTGDSRRLNIGYDSVSGEGNGVAAITRQAIMACVDHVARKAKRQLEKAITCYMPYPDRDQSDGWHERLLLEAMRMDNLSVKGRVRLNELRRKFPNHDIAVPSHLSTTAGFVGSPITESVAITLSDKEWLQAMRTYDYGWQDSGRHTNCGMDGTAVELARVLQGVVRSDRRRFADLALRMELTLRPEYFDAILEGLCSTANLTKEQRTLNDTGFEQLETEALLNVIQRVHELPDQPCGKAICTAIERMRDRDLPPEAMEILRYYAVSDPDPEDDNWSKHKGDSHDFLDEVHSFGYNTVRGYAAQTIQLLLFADYSRCEVLLPIVEMMLHDKSIAVRTCAIEALFPIWNHDCDKAVNLFVTACRNEPVIIASRPFDKFVRYASCTHYQSLRDILLTGLNSSLEPAQTVAARQICIAALTESRAQADAEVVRSGSVALRIGAAQVYSANMSDPMVGARCRDMIVQYFHDPSDLIRKIAADCFLRLGEDAIEQHVPIIEKYLESSAFPLGLRGLLRRLEDSKNQLPDITIRIADAFLQSAGTDAGDIMNSAATEAITVSTIVARLYTQSNDETIRSRCLDLIDKMELFGVFSMADQLDERER